MKFVILEDNEDRRTVMRSCLGDRFAQYEIKFFITAPAIIDYLKDHLDEAIHIALDHDLDMIPDAAGQLIDPGDGRDVAEFLAGRSPVCPVLIHSTNVNAAISMEMTLQEAGWATSRVTPFDDIAWIETVWFRALRDAVVKAVSKVSGTVDQPFEERANQT